MDKDRPIPPKMLTILKRDFPDVLDDDRTIIAPPPPDPKEPLYRFSYNSNTRYLTLNRIVVVKQFQLGKRNDEIFDKLFKKKGWVKKIRLMPPDRASQVIKVAGLPRTLSNAVFDSADNGRTLVMHTVITRERASDFHINQNEINDYMNKMRDKHYALLEANKRK
ncbi:MAG TPA: hypothetical protein QF549_03755 [Candidatus Saccharimonadaceae bacterium]|nr:hypothetical protein [Candidatus Saccharimonadaceae bacterium]